MPGKIKIELGKVQETLFLPLWGRAVETQKEKPRLVDKKAVDIINKIEYDFSVITKNMSWISQYSWVARSLHIDKAILNFISKYPHAEIVNIGCGLDTTFDRVDNGKIMFYELDLPDVIDLRKNFFPENERRKTISCSFLDVDWLEQLHNNEGVFFIAAGVFYYFEQHQIKNFFDSISKKLLSCEVLFDSASPFGVKVANQKVIKGGGMDESAFLKWGLKNARILESWNNNIKLINAYPMFKNMKKGFSLKMKYGLWLSDFLKILSMIHLRINGKMV